MTVCLLPDFKDQLLEDKSHIDQDLRRWRRRAGPCADLCNDDQHLFSLGPCTGVPGVRPWVATEACLKAIYERWYARQA